MDRFNSSQDVECAGGKAAPSIPSSAGHCWRQGRAERFILTRVLGKWWVACGSPSYPRTWCSCMLLKEREGGTVLGERTKAASRAATCATYHGLHRKIPSHKHPHTKCPTIIAFLLFSRLQTALQRHIETPAYPEPKALEICLLRAWQAARCDQQSRVTSKHALEDTLQPRQPINSLGHRTPPSIQCVPNILSDTLLSGFLPDMVPRSH